MSAYKRIQTEYRNLESLQAALAGLGIQCELAAHPQIPSLPLFGFQGDVRDERASLAIRQEQVNRFSGGMSNDIGLAWNGHEFEAIVSDYDQSRPGVQTMLQTLRQSYASHEVRRQAVLKGYTIREQKQQDGTLLLTLTRH